MRGGRGRVHVGQLNGRRGRRGVRHRGPVVTGIAAVPVVLTGIGRVAASVTASAAATHAGRWRVDVRAAVRAVGRVRRRCAGPVAAAPRRHAAALTASVVVCG